MRGLGCGGDAGDDAETGGGILRPVDNPQHQHAEDGPDGAQGNQAEAVAGGVFVTAGGGDAQAQGHDERDGDRSGGDASRVEGDGDKVVRGQEGQSKDGKVENQEQTAQGNAPPDAHSGRHQE